METPPTPPSSPPLVYCSLFRSSFSGGSGREGAVGPFVLSLSGDPEAEFAAFQITLLKTLVREEESLI